ncbi:MAG TPA: DUF1634 domain-containing protein [Anaeromyxobacteraceae bacterium]|nr:DUF1634 domain-containing protein [Anaeromyxobacteraceae bacterium]
MNRVVSLTLWIGTVAGVAFCAAAALADAFGHPWAARLAKLGVLALFATPPTRLAVLTVEFLAHGRRRLALASGTVLVVLLATAVRAAW